MRLTSHEFDNPFPQPFIVWDPQHGVFLLDDRGPQPPRPDVGPVLRGRRWAGARKRRMARTAFAGLAAVLIAVLVGIAHHG